MTVRAEHQQHEAAPSDKDAGALPVARAADGETVATGSAGDHPSAGEVEALLAVASAEPDDARAAEAVRRAAALCEEALAAPERALELLFVAFRKDPGNAATVAAVERLCERLGRLGDLLAEAEIAMLAAADPPALADLWTRVARWSRRLVRWDRAAFAAESALAIAPHHEAALDELEEAHRALEQWGPLARLLARRARAIAERGPRADRSALLDLHLEAAALFEERLGDDEQALSACERALALDKHNETALRRLERLAARLGRSALLLDVRGRRFASASSAAERLELALQLAAEWERFGRPGEARLLLEGQLAEGVEDLELLRALADLRRAAGDLEGYVDLCARRLARESVEAERAALSLEIGRALLGPLARPEEAASHLHQALAAEPETPTHAEAALLLTDHYRRTAQWAPLCDVLLQSDRPSVPVAQRVEALLEAAAIYRGKLGDERTARQIWGWVVAIDPRNEEAVETLAADAEAQRDWRRLRALLAPLCTEPGTASATTRASWHERLARAALAEGSRDEALVHRRAAARLVPDELGATARLAALLFDDGRLIEAAALLESMWAAPPDRFTDAERAELAFRLGRARRARGDLAGAAAALEAALTLCPGDVEILEALAAVADERRDDANAARWRRALLRAPLPADELVARAREAARLYDRRLGARDEAMAVLREALVEQPDSKPLLRDLLELALAAEAWRPAVDALLSLSTLEAPQARARHLVQAAQILSQHLGEDDEAIALYDQALDDDPEDFRSFERIDRILTDKRRFRDQEQSYRRMIGRLRGRDDARTRAAQLLLWRGLGEIYRTRLRDFAAAASAFEMAAKLEQGPTEVATTRLILGELYELGGPSSYDRAIDERRRLLTAAHDARGMGEHLRAIRRVAAKMNDADRAWRATDALVALEIADDEERRFHAGRTAELQLPDAPLPAAGWSMLAHSDEDAELSQLFAAVGRGLLALRSRDPEGWGLRPQSQEEQDGVERSVLGRLLAHMAGVLHVPRPGLQFRPDLPGTADMASVRGRAEVAPTLVAGADMLRVRSKRELACVLAKKVTLMRPEHYVLWPTVVPTLAELRVLLVALRRILEGPSTRVRPELERMLPPYERILRRVLGPQDLERAAALVPKLSAEASEVAGWARGAFLTASRVGYLVGSDLTTSLRTAAVESVGSLRVTPFEQIRDLVTWSLSDNHVALRRQLGLAPLRPALPERPQAPRIAEIKPSMPAPPSRMLYDGPASDPNGSRIYQAYEVAHRAAEPEYETYETGVARGVRPPPAPGILVGAVAPDELPLRHRGRPGLQN